MHLLYWDLGMWGAGEGMAGPTAKLLQLPTYEADHVCLWHTFSLRFRGCCFRQYLPMDIPDETFERFRVRLEEQFGEKLSFTDAKHRYLNMLRFFWILSHKLPTKGTPPFELPPPPWM